MICTTRRRRGLWARFAADEVDAARAVAAAKAAFPAWSQTTKQERIAALKRMHAAVAVRHDDLLEAVIEEYGAPASRSAWMASYPAEVIAQAIEALEAFEFVTPQVPQRCR